MTGWKFLAAKMTVCYVTCLAGNFVIAMALHWPWWIEPPMDVAIGTVFAAATL